MLPGLPFFFIDLFLTVDLRFPRCTRIGGVLVSGLLISCTRISSSSFFLTLKNTTVNMRAIIKPTEDTETIVMTRQPSTAKVSSGLGTGTGVFVAVVSVVEDTDVVVVVPEVVVPEVVENVLLDVLDTELVEELVLEMVVKEEVDVVLVVLEVVSVDTELDDVVEDTVD